MGTKQQRAEERRIRAEAGTRLRAFAGLVIHDKDRMAEAKLLNYKGRQSAERVKRRASELIAECPGMLGGSAAWDRFQKDLDLMEAHHRPAYPPADGMETCEAIVSRTVLTAFIIDEVAKFYHITGKTWDNFNAVYTTFVGNTLRDWPELEEPMYAMSVAICTEMGIVK